MKRPPKKSLLTVIEELNRAEKRKKNVFMPLERNFYRNMAKAFEEMQMEIEEHILKKEMERAVELSSELSKARNLYDEFLELRIRKILLAAVTPSMVTKNLTREELALYSDIKAVIENFKKSVLGEEPIAMEEVQPSASLSVGSSHSTPETPVSLDNTSQNVKFIKNEEPDSFVLVRVVAPTFRVAWVDGSNVTLRKEDVLHMPEKMYRILLKREKVVAIKLPEKTR